MKRTLIIILSIVFVNISYSSSIGFKYWNAPYNDDNLRYDHASLYGFTYSKQIDDNEFSSTYFLFGEYKARWLDGTNDKEEQDQLHFEHLHGISGRYFDVGYGIRSIRRTLIDNHSGAGQQIIATLDPIFYIGSAKYLTDSLSFYGGITYAPFSFILDSDFSDLEAGDISDDPRHFNYEVGLSMATSLLNLNAGYRYLEYIDSDDYYQDGFTFSVSKSL